MHRISTGWSEKAYRSWILWASRSSGKGWWEWGGGCLREEAAKGHISWVSGLDMIHRKLYPESKDYPHNSAVSGNITPWVKQVPCLHLANLSTKVAKAGCSTVYTVTFRAMIWHSLKQSCSQSQSSLVFDEPGIKALVGERWEQMERLSVLWNPQPRPPRVTTCEGSCKFVQRRSPAVSAELPECPIFCLGTED